MTAYGQKPTFRNAIDARSLLALRSQRTESLTFERAYGEREELGRASNGCGDASGIAFAVGAAPKAVCKHCDHSEGDFPLRRDERHGALGFRGSLLVELLGFAVLAVAKKFPRGSC